MWEMGRIYVSGTDNAVAWLRDRKMPFYRLSITSLAGAINALVGTDEQDDDRRDVPPERFERVLQPYRGEFTTWSEAGSVEPPESVVARLPPGVDVYGTMPDLDTLVGLKWIAHHVDGPVALYAAMTWGGALEYEWCWEFGRCERFVYAWADEEAADTNPSRGSLPAVVVYEVRGTNVDRQKAARDELPVLARMLRSFGIESPTGFFRPHQRDFDWESFR